MAVNGNLLLVGMWCIVLHVLNEVDTPGGNSLLPQWELPTVRFFMDWRGKEKYNNTGNYA